MPATGSPGDAQPYMLLIRRDHDGGKSLVIELQSGGSLTGRTEATQRAFSLGYGGEGEPEDAAVSPCDGTAIVGTVRRHGSGHPEIYPSVAVHDDVVLTEGYSGVCGHGLYLVEG